MDACPDTARGAKPAEIGRQAIGKIHHGCGEAILGEPRTQAEARLRIKVLAQSGIGREDAFLGQKAAKTGLRLTKTPADVYKVAGLGTRSQNCPTGAHFTNDSDLEQDAI